MTTVHYFFLFQETNYVVDVDTPYEVSSSCGKTSYCDVVSLTPDPPSVPPSLPPSRTSKSTSSQTQDLRAWTRAMSDWLMTA